MQIMTQTAAVVAANTRNPTAWLALVGMICSGLVALLVGSGLDEDVPPLAWKITLVVLNGAAMVSTAVREFLRQSADNGQNSGV
jgi:hypothetical protein